MNHLRPVIIVLLALGALLAVALLALLLGLSKTSAFPFNPAFEASVSSSAVSVNADLSLRTVVGSGEHLPLLAQFSFPAGSFNFGADSQIKPNGQTVGSGSLTIDRDCDNDDDTFPFTLIEVKSAQGDKTEYRTVGLPTWGPQTLILNGTQSTGHTIDVLMFFNVGGPPCLQAPLDLTFTFDGLSSGDSDPVVTNPSSLDVFKFAQRFGSAPSFTPDGKLPYAPRYDLNAAGGINFFDVFIIAQYFNKTCS